MAEGPLAGRHAVVTGASGGIGGAIASELATLGADVTLMGRNGATLEARRAALGGRAYAVTVDVGDPASVRRAFACARDALGPLAILVHGAGIAESAPFARTDLAMWRRVLDVDLTGAYLCIHEALPDLLAAGWGRVVAIASTAGLEGGRYISAYAAAKHGLVGLVRSLALETAGTGVTVNAVCPGYTDTPMTDRTIAHIAATTGRTVADARAALARSAGQARLVAPSEVADAVARLCLPASAVSGEAVVITSREGA